MYRQIVYSKNDEILLHEKFHTTVTSDSP